MQEFLVWACSLRKAQFPRRINRLKSLSLNGRAFFMRETKSNT